MTKTIRLIAFALLAAPLSGMTQRAPDPQPTDPEGQIVARINTIQARSGPGAPALIEPLTELAGLYHDAREFALAIPIIDRALGLVRNNRGLSSLEQAPLLRLALESERARGNLAGAWDTEQQLLRLARENPQDLRTVAILREIGDRRIDMLERYVAGDHVPEVKLGCYYKAPRHHMANCYSGSKSDAAASILLDASEMYRDAAAVILSLDIYPSKDLVELETGLARNFYLHGPPRSAQSAYELGRASLQRLYDYEVEHSGSLLDQTGALVRIADWDLVYVRQPLAIETYQRALDRLRAGGATQQEIASLFAPPTPVAIPSFLDNPLESGHAEHAAGHINIAFEITRYGRSRKTEVLESSANASEEAIDELTQAIKLSRFRPRIDSAGDFSDTVVTVRHYFEERQ
ncbi:MAG TPA: hypothetical protein VKQ06_02460 [Gammaproteobacteria bacterium]|nr:hypothetical protein [Gammaproteobacteria bacterium]